MIKLGVLADVHGNLAATEAVLADMRREQVDAVVFLGDVQGELHQPSETQACLRACEPLYAVRGNRERYLLALEGQSPDGWTDEQFATLYWNFHTLTPAERHWQENLPETMCLRWDGLPPLFCAHECWHLFGHTVMDGFNGLFRPDSYDRTPTDYAQLQPYFLKRLQRDARMTQALQTLEDGAYLFGHSHVQWTARFGGKLLVNPGACGLPLDLRTGGAPYTLLVGERGAWRAQERFLPYDVEAAIAAFQASSLFPAGGIYNLINVVQLRTGRLYWGSFLDFAEAMAQARGDARRPFDNALWREAAERWYEKQDDAFHGAL